MMKIKSILIILTFFLILNGTLAAWYSLGSIFYYGKLLGVKDSREWCREKDQSEIFPLTLESYEYLKSFLPDKSMVLVKAPDDLEYVSDLEKTDPETRNTSHVYILKVDNGELYPTDLTHNEFIVSVLCFKNNTVVVPKTNNDPRKNSTIIVRCKAQDNRFNYYTMIVSIVNLICSALVVFLFIKYIRHRVTSYL